MALGSDYEKAGFQILASLCLIVNRNFIWRAAGSDLGTWNAFLSSKLPFGT
jgi:hypothetical protein